MKHPSKTFAKYFFKQFFISSIPILLLGTLSFFLTYHDIYQTASNSVFKSLEQCGQFMNQILSEANTIEATFNPDSFSGFSLKHILKKKELAYKDAVKYPIFSSILNTFVNDSSFMESVYLYWPNDYGNLLVSNKGLTSLNYMNDTDWMETYEIFSNSQNDTRFIHSRTRKEADGSYSSTITVYQKILTLDYQITKGAAIININPSAIQKYLLQQCVFSTQQLYIFTDDGTFLAGSDKELSGENTALLENTVSMLFSQINPKETRLHISENGYTISMLKDETAPFFYVSVISNRQLYTMPAKLLYITAILVILSTITSLWLSASYSKNITHNIHSIMDIFQAAQKGEPLPPAPSDSNDEQNYIITNLISTFIKQEYLSVQLSEKIYREKALELVALQSQINPHFLFNTLETIRLKSFHLTDGPNNVSSLIENLSDIMRYTLSNPNEQVSLEQEIEYSKAYLYIQKCRYNDKFHVIWEYDTDILPIPVIKLLLQPLLENSIHHGIAPSSGDCMIKIKIFQRNHMLHIHIIDNGIGMDSHQKAVLLSRMLDQDTSYRHIGLSNTWKRLSLVYGDQTAFRILSKAGYGTAIILKLPAMDTAIQNTP